VIYTFKVKQYILYPNGSLLAQSRQGFRTWTEEVLSSTEYVHRTYYVGEPEYIEAVPPRATILSSDIIPDPYTGPAPSPQPATSPPEGWCE
jgi:hypothetical protein